MKLNKIRFSSFAAPDFQCSNFGVGNSSNPPRKTPPPHPSLFPTVTPLFSYLQTILLQCSHLCLNAQEQIGFGYVILLPLQNPLFSYLQTIMLQCSHLCLIAEEQIGFGCVILLLLLKNPSSSCYCIAGLCGVMILLVISFWYVELFHLVTVLLVSSNW
jgi:hypothetical protein